MFPCANCGEPVPDDALACRSCGSDAETGWREDVDYHSLELPEDPAQKPRGSGPSWPVKIAVVLLIIATFGGILRVAGAGGQGKSVLILIAVLVGVEVLHSAGILKRSFFRNPRR